jgi:hypothetical protein
MNDLTNSPLLRKAYSNKYKHQVLSYHKSSGGTLASTASYFGISDSLLSKWLKLPLFYFSTENMNSKRLGAGRSPEYPQLEELLFESVKAMRDKGLVVKYSKIKTLAKNIAARKSIDITDLKMCDNWVYRFCQRYGLSDRVKTHVAQECLKSPFEQCVIVSNYLSSIKNILSIYDPCQIFNMDETPLYVDMPGERTMHFRGAKTVDIINTGHEKLRFTVTLTINANGDILPAFLIFKNLKKIPRVTKNLIK